MYTQCCVSNKRLDLYFPKPNFGVEIDEYNHVKQEKIRQLLIEEISGGKIVRIKADAPDFNINRLINLVCMYIKS